MIILSQIDFEKVDLAGFDRLQLDPTNQQHLGAIGLEGALSAIQTTRAADLPLDLVFIPRQLLDVVPNRGGLTRLSQQASITCRAPLDEDSAIRRDLAL